MVDNDTEVYEEQQSNLSQMFGSSDSQQCDPSYHLQDEAGAYYEGDGYQYNEEQAYYNEYSVLQTAVLYTGNNLEECMKLEVEVQNSGVVDTAYTSCLCGKQWLDVYLNSLNKQDCNDTFITSVNNGNYLGGAQLYELCIPAT